MQTIRIKRIYDEQAEDDGYRVLVDRLWPRGVKKEALLCNSWNKDLAPSSELRKWVHENKEERWELFASLYIKQLGNSKAVDDFLLAIKDFERVTLLTATKSMEQNHAGILKEYLENRLF